MICLRLVFDVVKFTRHARRDMESWEEEKCWKEKARMPLPLLPSKSRSDSRKGEKVKAHKKFPLSFFFKPFERRLVQTKTNNSASINELLDEPWMTDEGGKALVDLDLLLTTLNKRSLSKHPIFPERGWLTRRGIYLLFSLNWYLELVLRRESISSQSEPTAFQSFENLH